MPAVAAGRKEADQKNWGESPTDVVAYESATELRPKPSAAGNRDIREHRADEDCNRISSEQNAKTSSYTRSVPSYLDGAPFAQPRSNE